MTMTPTELISWALAIGLSWAILATCIPVETWISSLIDALKKRRQRSSDDSKPSDPSAD